MRRRRTCGPLAPAGWPAKAHLSRATRAASVGTGAPGSRCVPCARCAEGQPVEDQHRLGDLAVPDGEALRRRCAAGHHGMGTAEERDAIAVGEDGEIDQSGQVGRSRRDSGGRPRLPSGPCREHGTARRRPRGPARRRRSRCRNGARSRRPGRRLAQGTAPDLGVRGAVRAATRTRGAPHGREVPRRACSACDLRASGAGVSWGHRTARIRRSSGLTSAGAAVGRRR